MRVASPRLCDLGRTIGDLGRTTGRLRGFRILAGGIKLLIYACGIRVPEEAAEGEATNKKKAEIGER